MITIDSELGYALAKAKMLMDEHEAHILNGTHDPELERIVSQYESAADAVANALIAQGMHKMDGL